ncbi:MAG: envelope biogenesis factor ElyC [bacterium]|nr:envelope biogenesis factor ElyC [bacterium]
MLTMFILKKIVSQFLFPIFLSFEFSLIGLVLLWFTKRQRAGKVLVSIGLLLMLALSYGAVSNRLLKPLERKYEPYERVLARQAYADSLKKIKFIVVLGAGHQSDPNIPTSSQLDEDALARLVEGIRIYRKHRGSKLILSGGSIFDPIPHAYVLARVAQELGVSESDIIIEPWSKDTRDEALLIKPIVGPERFILVTSASHMSRSMALFQNLGLNPIPAPAGYLAKDEQRLSISSFFPSARNLRKAERVFYEYLGITWARLRDQVPE